MNNKDNIIVSVRCFVYNHEPYLHQCLDGLVMQKTNFPFEIIVHDDVSTDGSIPIIEEYAKKYPEIIVPIYETENQYSKRDGSLRRIVNAYCHGKYIATCEGDDYWTDPNKLQKQIDVLEQDETLSCCFHKCHTTNGIQVYSDVPPRNRLTAKDIILHHYIPTASLIYRADLMKNVDDFKLTIGDIPTEVQLAMQGDVFFIDEFMSVYRNDNLNLKNS